MRVAGVQHDIVWEQRDTNLAHVAPMIEQAAAAGARLVVLTEMFSTGFSMASERIAEPENGPSTEFLRAQAELHDLWVCASIPVRAPERVRPVNRLVLAGPRAHGTTTTRSTRSPTAGRTSTTTRRRVPHGRDRGAAGQLLRLLRPAVRGRVLGAGDVDRLLRRRRELARVAPQPLARASCRPSDREPGLRRRREPGRERA